MAIRPLRPSSYCSLAELGDRHHVGSPAFRTAGRNGLRKRVGYPTDLAPSGSRSVEQGTQRLLAEPLPRLDGRASFSGVEDLLTQRPDAELAIVDLHLANSFQPSARQGVAAIQAVVEAGYRRVCVYSQEERRFVLAAAIAAGAQGVVSKAAPAAIAEQAFVDVAQGRNVIPQSITSLAHVLARRGRLSILSDRQRELLTGRARGQTYAEISRTMFLSESTLRGYWHDITQAISTYLTETGPADIEHALGLRPGDLLDFWPPQRGGPCL